MLTQSEGSPHRLGSRAGIDPSGLCCLGNNRLKCGLSISGARKSGLAGFGQTHYRKRGADAPVKLQNPKCRRLGQVAADIQQCTKSSPVREVRRGLIY